jgi:hypothetical protein
VEYESPFMTRCICKGPLSPLKGKERTELKNLKSFY